MDADWRRRLVVEERKVRDYLLDIDHPVGGRKAHFFIDVGFARSDHTALCEVLLLHGRMQPLIETSVVRGEMRYRVEGPVTCPNTMVRTVRTIWSDEGEQVRLVTAYPIGRNTR